MSSFFANLILLAYVECVSELTHFAKRKEQEREMAVWRDKGVIVVRDVVDASFFAEMREWKADITHMQVDSESNEATIWFEMAALPTGKKTDFMEAVHALDSVKSVEFN